MNAPVRVGVVGTSWFADALHLPALKSHPHAQIVALCGRNPVRADELAAKYAIPQVFGDYREMIAQASLDAVAVVTPDDLHFPVALAALEAGCHVLCEKPLTLRAAQARTLWQTAEAAGVRHMVFFTLRGLPIYRQARTLLDQGAIGRCRHATIRYLTHYGEGGSYRWRFDRRRANGILGDLGSHLIDLARWYVGEIVSVSALLGVFVDRPGPDGAPPDPANDAASLLVEFDGGAQGVIQVSAVARTDAQSLPQSLALHGDQGALELEFSFATGAARLRCLHPGEETFQTTQTPPGEVLAPFFAESVGPRGFIDAIREGRDAAPTFYDGYRAQAVIDAAIASQEQGVRVRVG